jgi:hypothetical protein
MLKHTEAFYSSTKLKFGHDCSFSATSVLCYFLFRLLFTLFVTAGVKFISTLENRNYSSPKDIIILWSLVGNFFYNFGVTFITNLIT